MSIDVLREINYIYIYLSSWVFKGSCRFKTNASSSGLAHHALDNALPGSTSAFALSGWPSLSLLALSMVTRFLKTASGMTGGMMHVWKVLSIISELLKIWSLVSGGLYSPLNFSFMHLKGIKVPRGQQVLLTSNLISDTHIYPFLQCFRETTKGCRN